MTGSSAYKRLLGEIFSSRYAPGATEVEFSRTDIETAAARLGLARPKNRGDVVYSARYRGSMPSRVTEQTPEGRQWVIRGTGRGTYCFALVKSVMLAPDDHMGVTKILDATPGIVDRYALGDEQALLAKLRYNRLVDVFLGITCYSLQNHLRTNVREIGQVETDEIYVGMDKRGVHYVVPMQAKGGTDSLSIVQIEQDWALCAERFPAAVCRPVAAQVMDDEVIALFEFEHTDGEMRICSEHHYRLVRPDALTTADLQGYRLRPGQD